MDADAPGQLGVRSAGLGSRRISPQRGEVFVVMSGALWGFNRAGMGPDPDIYNIKHGFERLGVTGQRLPNSIELELLRHARRALLPLPLIDRRRRPASDVFPPFRKHPATRWSESGSQWWRPAVVVPLSP